MSSATRTTDTQSSASVVEFAPHRDVSLIVNIISILRTLYIFLIKENPLVWWFLQGKRNPRADVEGAPNRNIGVGKGVLASIADLKQFTPFLFKLVIQDPKGEPIPNANVDIWQATWAGEYSLRTYRLRGQFKTGSKGEVEILSVAPGKYGPPNLQRAGHFHIIIKDPKGKFENLTTQVYVCQGNQSTEMASDFVNFARAQRHANMLVCWSIPSATGGKALMEFPELPSDDVETQESTKWWNERLAERDQSLQIAAGGETAISDECPPDLVWGILGERKSGVGKIEEGKVVSRSRWEMHQVGRIDFSWSCEPMGADFSDGPSSRPGAVFVIAGAIGAPPQRHITTMSSEGYIPLSQDPYDNHSDLEGVTFPPDELVLDQDANAGVKTVEAAEKVYGPHSKWFLFAGLALASYVYSLDGSTTYTYLSFAASSFGEHSLISSIQVAQSIIIAVGKPIIAKLADVTSRATAYLAVLIFYVIGYIVIASAQNVGAIAGGIILYAVGYTGLQLLTQVIIADITTLKWRGLVSSLTSAPFIVNAFIGSNISAAVLQHAGWRWGYGMFAILVPASLSPLIVTLFWAETKAKSLGLVKQHALTYGDSSSTKADDSFTRKAWRFAEHLDLIGLILLGAAVALVLLPLTLSQTVKSGWENPSIIAMLVIGFVLFFVFGSWDFRYAKRPVIALRFVKNRSVLGAAWIGFFDFVSFYLTNTYLWSFVIVVKPWTLVNANYFTSTQTVALTVFGIIAGLCMRYVQRYKWVLVVGLCVRLLGVGLMIHSRGANASDVEIVWTQILQGMGGGFAAVASQVGAQASVPHADVAIITAVVLLWTEIGGGVGNAIAGAIWTNTMPKNLAKYLPFLSDAERKELFGSITDVIKYPRGDPTREGVISAYDDTMKILVIAATCLSVIPILLALTMPNWYLGDKQNAVDDSNLAGERVADDHEEIVAH